MILAWLVAIPAGGGLLAWLAGRKYPRGPRWIALGVLAGELAAVLMLTAHYADRLGAPTQGLWLTAVKMPWIPSFGIDFALALDGFSLLLVLLTAVLGIMALASAWTEIEERAGFFYFNLLWVLSGITGVFLATDLFLFYFFWEMMLIPMVFLILLWGHANRVYAATKFFLFTQISGLLMLLAILALYFLHGRATGVYTFDYHALMATDLSPGTARWLMLGFLAAFLVKLPAVPVHSWLPDAHTEAPTPGSVILAGLLLKTGAYGLVRFAVPLFPAAAAAFAPVGMALGVVSILYGALLALGQSDLKRLVAYTSVSHMGFVMLGVFAWNPLALQGVVMQMICHGISTGALFMLVGALQQRLGTRDLKQMGGLWSTMPRMGAIFLVFAMASLGLPGLGNFIAEFLILLGAFQVSVLWSVLAAVGLVAASVYALRMLQASFHGAAARPWKAADLSLRETAAMACMVVIIVWLGLFPQWVLDTARGPLQALERSAVVQTRREAPVIMRLAGQPDAAGATQGGRP
jgi:NADH-quinone oxidoreductase subunit M